jgi:RimJ/RimL family protein N-acetyltransferase
VIETARLLLRKPRLEDTDALHEVYSDPEVMRYIGLGDTFELDETRAWIEKALVRWDANGFGHFVIEHDGRVVGRCGFLVWDPRSWRTGTLPELGEHAEVEVGWMLGRAHWGNGYALEAASACRDHAFHELGLARLISLIAPGNERSVRVAEGIGSRYERDVERDEWRAQVYAVERRT